MIIAEGPSVKSDMLRVLFPLPIVIGGPGNGEGSGGMGGSGPGSGIGGPGKGDGSGGNGGSGVGFGPGRSWDRSPMVVDPLDACTSDISHCGKQTVILAMIVSYYR